MYFNEFLTVIYSSVPWAKDYLAKPEYLVF